MSTENESLEPLQLEKYTSRKVRNAAEPGGETRDSLAAWIESYLALAVTGVRSEAIADKIELHLGRFAAFFHEAYGHDRISTPLKRDVCDWQRSLVSKGLASSTVNNHLASLSAFTTWMHAHDPQLRSLKSVCDRLERFHTNPRWPLFLLVASVARILTPTQIQVKSR